MSFLRAILRVFRCAILRDFARSCANPRATRGADGAPRGAHRLRDPCAQLARTVRVNLRFDSAAARAPLRTSAKPATARTDRQ
ncbi:hypothetical protein AB7M35_003508 [Amorphus suaedae]